MSGNAPGSDLPQGCFHTLGSLFGAGGPLAVFGIITGALFVLLAMSQTLGRGAPGPGPTGGGPPVNARGVPAMSERYPDSGTTHASVTGAFSLSGDIAIDPVASYVSNTGTAWLAFGSDPNALLVLVTFHEPEDTVTVTQGVLRATGTDSQCTFNVTVTETLISGHISCPSIDAFNADEKVGTARIELDFSAVSPPGGGDGGDSDYDEGDPDQ